MSFSRKPPRSYTLLLTLWQERDQDADVPAVWRFRLEDPRTGLQRGFASLEALMAELRRETTTPSKD